MNKLAGISLISCLLSCSPKFNIETRTFIHNPGIITFIPKNKYFLKSCLHGDYVVTKQNNALIISYIQKGHVYQNAILGYDSNIKDWIVSSVEVDFNHDNICDMLLQSDADFNLKIVDSNYKIMSVYIK